MLAKIIIIIAMIVIVVSLGSGLFFLVNDQKDSKRVVKALTIRIAISLTLFILILVAAAQGWIHPHGL